MTGPLHQELVFPCSAASLFKYCWLKGALSVLHQIVQFDVPLQNAAVRVKGPVERTHCVFLMNLRRN